MVGLRAKSRLKLIDLYFIIVFIPLKYCTQVLITCKYVALAHQINLFIELENRKRLSTIKVNESSSWLLFRTHDIL